MERGEQEGMPRVHAFNTFFYPKVMSDGQQAVKRWTKKVDIFSMEFILVPVHLGMHWCLAVSDGVIENGLGLGCLITPGLSKDIRCHVWPYFF